MEAKIAALSLTPILKDNLSIRQNVLSNVTGRGMSRRLYTVTNNNGVVFAIKSIERNRMELEVLKGSIRKAEEAYFTDIIRLIKFTRGHQSDTDNLHLKVICFPFKTATYCTLTQVVMANLDNTSVELKFFHTGVQNQVKKTTLFY